MTIKTASFAYQYWDGLAVQFPRHAAVQRARLRAYQDWLAECRAFRNGDCCALDDAGAIVKLKTTSA